jgi:excisionase family DNA binding protein
MQKQYYTVEQIAKLLNIHPKTVQRYIREGKIHATKIGKSWRVNGHDLSLFTEDNKNETEKNDMSAKYKVNIKASCVVDIDVEDKYEAICIMNNLTAALNVKPPEYGNSTMHIQYLEEENKVRITLWGNIAFMTAMMQSIEVLTNHFEEE